MLVLSKEMQRFSLKYSSGLVHDDVGVWPVLLELVFPVLRILLVVVKPKLVEEAGRQGVEAPAVLL